MKAENVKRMETHMKRENVVHKGNIPSNMCVSNRLASFANACCDSFV